MWTLPLRLILTLILAGLAGYGCTLLHTPIPWMMGPLVMTSVLSVMGLPVASWAPARNAGQWVIGAALGLYFTPEVGHWLVNWWWAIALGVVGALGLGWGWGYWLAYVCRDELARLSPGRRLGTVHFSSTIGAASEMTLMAERFDARTDWVASAHSLRVLLVTLVLPFVVQVALGAPEGQSALSAAGGWMGSAPAHSVHPTGLIQLIAFTGVGIAIWVWVGGTNPWFMGSLWVAIGLALMQRVPSGWPTSWIAGAQVVIGISLGVRFSPAFLGTAPRWLMAVGSGSFVLMGLGAALAAGLTMLTGLPLAAMLLSTAPGGIAEMSITAKTLQLAVPLVTAFQVCRLVAVLTLAVPWFRWRLRRLVT